MLMKSAAQTTDTPAGAFGPMLKAWRSSRKLSQLDLALEADVSQRHLSFLESGRAQPSREMILNLAEALDIPLRERNTLLGAGGFAPLYRERDLDADDMKPVREALELTLKHHEPYPAIVVNREWDMLMSNTAAERMYSAFGDPAAMWQEVDPSGRRNALRYTFHPKGLQPHIANWEEVVTVMLNRLQREAAMEPGNTRLKELVEELCSYPGMPDTNAAIWQTPPHPILPLEVNMGGMLLKTFTMISTFGTPQDITTDELRLETFFPADDFTEQILRQMAQSMSG